VQKEKVRKAYGEIARTRNLTDNTECCDTACCREETGKVNEISPDYSAEEIASVPQGAFLGEGSGNPVRAAKLQPGETVVDLGAGAGMDSFLAAGIVGEDGHVYGFDMTPDMLERSQANKEKGRYPQVEFQKAEIDALPLPGSSADAIISNCVINLAPDKLAVYKEIFRTLKPGGRFAIADIVLRGNADLVYQNADKLPGCSCLTTALEENLYLATIRQAGFEGVEIVNERAAISQKDIETFARLLGVNPDDAKVSAHAVTLVGRKPATAN
jgi:SAM-dependent methyltransferase